MTPSLRILKPGLLTTVQDLGRVGYQHLGVSISGALDPISLRAANALVGNPAGTGALEVAYIGPTFIVEADSAQLACVGADATIEILPDEHAASGIRVPCMQTFHVRRGEVVRIGALTGGSTLYIAVEGGFDIEPVLGSVSTFLRAGLGGWQGRSLIAGDSLPLRLNSASDRGEFRLEGLNLKRPARFRAIPGPQLSYFSPRSFKALFDSEFIVKPESDRMAMHLSGPKVEHAAGFDIVSDGIAMGSIQVPGNGQPLVLMADRQTTGGYPKIATVISADLPALGRVRMGEAVVFEEVSIEQAQDLLRQLLKEIEAIPGRVVPLTRSTDEITTQLLMSNLISGAINANRPHVAD